MKLLKGMMEISPCLAEVDRLTKDKLGKLEVLNAVLEKIGIEPQTSLSKCYAIFEREVFINIYDFAEGNILLHKDLMTLMAYSRASDKIYPLKRAKANPSFRCLLKHLYR